MVMRTNAVGHWFSTSGVYNSTRTQVQRQPAPPSFWVRALIREEDLPFPCVPPCSYLLKISIHLVCIARKVNQLSCVLNRGFWESTEIKASLLISQSISKNNIIEFCHQMSLTWRQNGDGTRQLEWRIALGSSWKLGFPVVDHVLDPYRTTAQQL